MSRANSFELRNVSIPPSREVLADRMTRYLLEKQAYIERQLAYSGTVRDEIEEIEFFPNMWFDDKPETRTHIIIEQHLAIMSALRRPEVIQISQPDLMTHSLMATDREGYQIDLLFTQVNRNMGVYEALYKRNEDGYPLRNIPSLWFFPNLDQARLG